MPARVLEIMSRGGTLANLAAEFGITKTHLLAWASPEHPQYHEDFAEAYEQGLALSEAWWLDQGRTHLVTDASVKFNSPVWSLAMKNLHGWREKNELAGSQTDPIVVIGDQGTGAGRLRADPEPVEDEPEVDL